MAPSGKIVPGASSARALGLLLGHIQGRVASVAPDSSNPARFFASPRKTLLPFDIISMVASEIEQLAETIKECIAIRGIYLLMDERLDLICGPETLENIDSPQVTQKMAEFAARYGWSITRYQGGFDRRQENPVNLSTLNLKPRKKS